jgi:hypothetical protein
MQFVLETSYGAESATSVYSKENQALITSAFNNGTDVVNVYHEIQDGVYKGKVVQHVIYVETRSVKIIGQISMACGRLKLVPVIAKKST